MTDDVICNKRSRRNEFLTNERKSAQAAVEASEVIAVCVLDYGASDALLHTPEVEARLKGKVVVQFTTGTSRQAREAEAWAQQIGIKYLDAALAPRGRSFT